MKEEQGLIAILDALGAANYSKERIEAFLKARAEVVNVLNLKATEIRIDRADIETYTFGDTVLIAYKTETEPSLKHVKSFAALLRKVAVKSLEYGILFRGAIGIGKFYEEPESNSVLGDAVGDAAAWYELADWVGIIATPQASMIIQSLVEQADYKDFEGLMLDYDVPLKGGGTRKLKAVNWPRAFYVPSMSPCSEGERKRAKCLSLLAAHGVPRGAELKHFNTMAFFERGTEQLKEEQRNKKKEDSKKT